MAVVAPKSDNKPQLPARRHSLDIVPGRRTSRSSFTRMRTNDWVLTTDVPSDLVVEAGGLNFSLHKFPLVARSGRIRKLIANSEDTEVNQLQLPDVPGGAEAFDLAAKFCYGINFEITPSNVAVLRCAAEYLEMTDSFGENNLVSRTEAFLSEIILKNLADSIAVLHNCESLLPLAEDLLIVSRCIEAAAAKACREQITNSMNHSDFGGSGQSEKFKLSFSSNTPYKASLVDWWVEDLAVLRIDFYQRVLSVLRSKGLPVETIGAALMHYAHRSLKGLNRKQNGRGDPRLPRIKAHESATSSEHEQRILLETIVSLLPSEKTAVPCSFLFSLLRTAIILDTTVACRLDLETRIGMQLEQATLDDLLIPSFSYTGDTLFDVDIVQRIAVNFLQQDESDDHQQVTHLMYDSDGVGSPSQSAMMKVAKLVDNYLAEIAPDANLKLTKFIALAEILPEYARVVDDGLYRAIDIYLKAHPALAELERKKLCKLMDCQKLSQEACSHAAQNERLPVQLVVQILYFEQLRMRNAMAAGAFADHGDGGNQYAQGIGSGNASTAHSPKDSYASVRRENRELKLEISRMRMRLTDLEKDHASMKQDMLEKQPSKQNNIISSVSRKISRLNPFARKDSKENISTDKPPPPTPNSRPRVFGRRRRHSIS
ncbi:unnamed protein product [Sphagnum troendelagicum]|uniref:Phototropic-responsive NPH3 family protein n=1 Tax=Sphagnum troendelagicum TaxID=128251 RepID=A0ABP0V2D2_9BRYO